MRVETGDYGESERIIEAVAESVTHLSSAESLNQKAHKLVVVLDHDALAAPVELFAEWVPGEGMPGR